MVHEAEQDGVRGAWRRRLQGRNGGRCTRWRAGSRGSGSPGRGLQSAAQAGVSVRVAAADVQRDAVGPADHRQVGVAGQGEHLAGGQQGPVPGAGRQRPRQRRCAPRPGPGRPARPALPGRSPAGPVPSPQPTARAFPAGPPRTASPRSRRGTAREPGAEEPARRQARGGARSARGAAGGRGAARNRPRFALRPGCSDGGSAVPGAGLPRVQAAWQAAVSPSIRRCAAVRVSSAPSGGPNVCTAS